MCRVGKTRMVSFQKPRDLLRTVFKHVMYVIPFFYTIMHPGVIFYRLRN